MIVLPLWVQGLGWGGGRGSDRGCAGLRHLGRLGLPERVLGKLETETAAQRPQAVAEGEIFLSSCSSHLGAGSWEDGWRRCRACLPGWQVLACWECGLGLGKGEEG